MYKYYSRAIHSNVLLQCFNTIDGMLEEQRLQHSQKILCTMETGQLETKIVATIKEYFLYINVQEVQETTKFKKFKKFELCSHSEFSLRTTHRLILWPISLIMST